MTAMQPLVEFPIIERRRIKVVLADIDDTLTTGGRLPSCTIASLEQLQQSGFIVVPVTGRPAGWCDHFARMWPVDAVVGENGALYFSYDHRRRKMTKVYWKDEESRAKDRLMLHALREKILGEVAGAGIASDQEYRVADLAIDFCEDVPPLGPEDVDRIVGIFEGEGAHAKISSIHVNGWFGDYDKLSMTVRCLRDLFGIDLHTANDSIAFIGDSPNDAPMFAFFRQSVGVANVASFVLTHEPRWVTVGASAAGFVEFAESLLAAGNGHSSYEK